jgi:hypothetical protein
MEEALSDYWAIQQCRWGRCAERSQHLCLFLPGSANGEPRRTKTMRKLIPFIIISILFAGTAFAKDEIQCGDEDVKALVQKLTEEVKNFDETIAVLDSLAKKPSVAVGCLIKELHTVNEVKMLSGELEKPEHKETDRVVWCIRALRYITGKDFRGKTTHQFRKDEEERKYWVTLESPKGRLRFFCVHMAVNSTYFAPKDAQQSIIDQWKKWYRREGEKASYNPVLEFNDWYF